ncbi:MAG: helix-turn-helix domain-containing protein [Lachnospiraceae bacterium]|nr:helix-turn-helix domain-containing protein [Lachnospiraceae bacterium]
MIGLCDRKLKLVRAEYGYSQERMAAALGLSKKTLLEIEKGRSSLGWTGTAALCAVFRSSELLISSFGGDPAELAAAMALDGFVPERHSSAGPFWTPVSDDGGWIVVQNVISQHYRLFSPTGELIASSFDPEELRSQIPDAKP